MVIRMNEMSRDARKPDICLCENKGADQLRSNCEADQRLCFRYSDSTIPLLLKSEISSFYSFLSLYRPVCVGPGRKPRRPVFSRRGSNQKQKRRFETPVVLFDVFVL